MLRLLTRSAATLALAAVLLPAAAFASSHSEAPGTAKDRFADDTDLYAWVAADAADKVTIVGNWAPMLEPNGGPNFYAFDDEVTYYINVDNVGDAQDHIRYAFQFRTERRNPNTFLYNTGPVNSISDPNLNVRQFCTVTRIENGTATVLATDVQVAPNFVGPVSMKNYGALAQQAVRTLPDGSKLFIGPRDDPFFVDLGAIFDLLTIRKPPGNRGRGVDGLVGFDVLTIAIQVPMTSLTSDHKAPNASNGVIGIYDSAERLATRTINGDGTVSTSGERKQVSRLGMPLVNEVVIPLGQKDLFNASKPSGDGQFLGSVINPELAGLLTALYGIKTPPAPRNDLVAVFLTGIPGLNKPANPAQAACEMLRLNMTIAPAKLPSRFGLLGGDVAGFPNGRRLGDDVVDIAERVVAGATPFTPEFNVAPNKQLGDGVNFNDVPFLPYFPYVALPHNPLDRFHHIRHGRIDPRFDVESDDRDEADVASNSSEEVSTTDEAEAVTGGNEPQPGIRVLGANPSRTSRLEFTLGKATHAAVKVFDAQGRMVRTLLDQDAAAGTFSAQWNGQTDAGTAAGPGIYFVRMATGERTYEKKVVLQ